jgi:hypothetical protein
MRRHRPKKPFRFEYIKGKFSHLTKEERYARGLDKLEEDEIRSERFEEYVESRLREDRRSGLKS